MSTQLNGYIGNIVYQNDANGFTIAKFSTEDSKTITIQGILFGIPEKESLNITGNWIDTKYGAQFKIDEYKIIIPNTASGMEKYLTSNFIVGIGKVTAKAIVDKFGDDTLNVLDNEPDKLLSITGIGRKKLDTIIKSWNDNVKIRDIMIYLQEYGVSPAYAAKIYKIYGEHTKEIISKNPYRLYHDVSGIGFKISDKIARNFGYSLTDNRRIEAGILYVLSDSANSDGNTCLPKDIVISRSVEILEIKENNVSKILDSMIKSHKLKIEKTDDDILVFTEYYHNIENIVAKRLLELNKINTNINVLCDVDKLKIYDVKDAIELSNEQIQTIKSTINNKVSVVTGSAGTGKTTILNVIAQLHRDSGYEVSIGCPTGRAAKRVTEITGFIAKTIHRLLEYNPVTNKFKKDKDNKLYADIIIIDESSMVDIYLMKCLLDAIRDDAKLVLVGDYNQLPSVGAGAVLHDIIYSEQLYVSKLEEIHRQAKNSGIIINSDLINKGKFPITKGYKDFIYVNRTNSDDIFRTTIKIVKHTIPEKLGYDPLTEVQVISPMNKGVLGSIEFNSALQCELITDKSVSLRRGYNTYYLNDRVMQTSNNYDLDVFNGDIGNVVDIDTEYKSLTVDFDSKKVQYSYEELEQLAHARCITIHKSQGSEYPCVVIVLGTSHYIMLKRNLLYTAITRSRKHVIIVGDSKALNICINNDQVEKRYTYLKEFMLNNSSGDNFLQSKSIMRLL